MTPIDRCLKEIAYCQEQIENIDTPPAQKEGAILGVCDWFIELLLIKGELDLRES